MTFFFFLLWVVTSLANIKTVSLKKNFFVKHEKKKRKKKDNNLATVHQGRHLKQIFVRISEMRNYHYTLMYSQSNILISDVIQVTLFRPLFPPPQTSSGYSLLKKRDRLKSLGRINRYKMSSSKHEQWNEKNLPQTEKGYKAETL